MDIRHTDNGGTPWAFSIDCTPYQAELLKQALTTVRNIGGRAKLTARYYGDYEANEAFCRGIERVVLSALHKAFPMIQYEEQETPQIQQPTATPQPEEPEERKTYYWENF